MNLTVLSDNQQLTMSSLEIAELTGKRHDNVMRDIQGMLVELGGVLSFEDTYTNPQNGQKYPCFKLPKRESLILVSGYSVVLRSKIIDRWQELEQKALPKQQAITLDPVIRSSQIAEATFKTLCVFGIDKNSAIISASQVGFTHTGVNIYKDAQLALEAPNQKHLPLTATELGNIKGITANKMNKLLAENDFQFKVGKDWTPTEKANGFFKLLDSGKKHSNGTPITQLKWYESVLAELQE